jgi:hypothetical protein
VITRGFVRFDAALTPACFLVSDSDLTKHPLIKQALSQALWGLRPGSDSPLENLT